MRYLLRCLRLGVPAVLLAVTLLGTGTQPASAAAVWPSHSSYVWSNSGWSNMRGCPSTGCSVITSFGNGSAVWMMCWTDSQWAYGNYWSNRWFYVWSANKTGYIHSSLVYRQASVPRC